MKHFCLNCKISFDCMVKCCDDPSHKTCSVRCKNAQEKKRDIQEELSAKLFPNGEWH